MSSGQSMFDDAGQALASVVRALDVEKVRVHFCDQSTGFEVSLDGSERATSIQWVKAAAAGEGQDSTPKSKKKRKRASLSNEPKNQVLYVGLNNGSMLVVDAKSRDVSRSAIPDAGEIYSICESSSTSGGVWTCDSSSQLRRIKNQKVVDTVESPEAGCQCVLELDDKTLLAASSKAVVLELSGNQEDSTKPVKQTTIKSSIALYTTSVSHVVPLTTRPELVLCNSTDDRVMYIIDTSETKSQPKPFKVLTCEDEVVRFAVSSDDQTVAAITQSGHIEVFTNVLGEEANSKSKKRGTSQTSARQFQLVRNKFVVPAQAVQFKADQLVVAWYENGIDPVFEHIKWDLENQNMADSSSNSAVVQVPVSSKNVNGTNSSNNNITNDGRDVAAPVPYGEADVVTTGADFQHLDNQSEEEDDDENDDTNNQSLADRLDALYVADNNNNDSKNNSNNDSNSTSKNRSSLPNGTSSMLNGNIESHGNGQTDNKHLSKMRAKKTLGDISAPGSFALVLNQALKTKDEGLLDVCIDVQDTELVKSSVAKLDSRLAADLLERLAEKLVKEPQQTILLNVWIKWVMILHGGYLVTLPNLLKSLSSLHASLAHQTNTLPRLLALQGRLELLDAQLELRRGDQMLGMVVNGDDEDEEAVEYIEDGDVIVNGEEDFDQDDEEIDEDEDEDVEVVDQHDSDESVENGFISIE